MRLQLSKRLLASLAVAGALTGGMLLTPASAQEVEKKVATVTVSGTALNPDGTPGAKLPVVVKAFEKKLAGGADPDSGNPAPPDLLSQGRQGPGKGSAMKTLAKGMTDDSGKFSLKFQTLGQGDQIVQLEIGQNTKTPWMTQSVTTKGKDVDLGNIQLREPVRG